MANFILSTCGAMESAERELLRFLVVAREHEAATGEAAPMPDCAVDVAWHRLLQRPARHAALARAATGGAVGHVEEGGEGELTWVPRYERRHGGLPPVWFSDRDGVVDERRYAAYEAAGATEPVRAAWRCKPELRPLPADEPERDRARPASVGAIA